METNIIASALGILTAVIVFLVLRRFGKRPNPGVPTGPSPTRPAESPGSGSDGTALFQTVGSRIEITHPMIRKAAARALQKGSGKDRFLVKAGDQIYLSLDGFTDPAERQRAEDIIARLESGAGDVGMDDLMWLGHRIGGE